MSILTSGQNDLREDLEREISQKPFHASPRQKLEEYGSAADYEDMLDHNYELMTDGFLTNAFGDGMDNSLNESCIICYQEQSSAAEDTWTCLACRTTACNECFSLWLETKIFAGLSQTLTCMTCPVQIGDVDIQRICGQRTYRKLLYFRSRSDLRENPQAIWCPSDDCLALIYDRPVPAIYHHQLLACGECSQEVCARCGDAIHSEGACKAPSFTIAGAIRRTRAKIWTGVHTRKCPECSTPIERSGGCKHMRCTICSSHFCWICRGYLKEFVPHGANKRLCVCRRIHGAAIFTVLIGGTVLGLPVVVVSAIVGLPPMLAIYGVSSASRKARMRALLQALWHTLEEVVD